MKINEIIEINNAFTEISNVLLNDIDLTWDVAKIYEKTNKEVDISQKEYKKIKEECKKEKINKEEEEEKTAKIYEKEVDIKLEKISKEKLKKEKGIKPFVITTLLKYGLLE